jgi:O-antigen ligase
MRKLPLASVRERFPIPALIAVLWVTFADGLRSIGVQGVATVAVAGLLLLLLPVLIARRDVRGRSKYAPLTQSPRGVPGVLWVFLLWVGLTVAFNGMTGQGLQNVLLYVIFIITMAYCAQFSSDDTGTRLLTYLRNGAVVGACLWLPTIITTGIGTDGAIVSRGGAASVCVIGMVASVGLGRVSRSATLAPYFFALVIAATLSRLALITAAVLLVAVGFARSEKIGRALVFRTVLIVAAAVATFLSYEPLQRRFLENDGQSIAGFNVGTSGRTALWNELLSHLNEHNIIAGRGAGTAEQTIADAFIRITQPHSDYLRILNDFGLIGLGLYVVTLLALLTGSVKRWRAAPPEHRPIHLSAALSILILVVYAFLDNTVTYIFVMAPIAAIVGVSLSRPGVDPSQTDKALVREQRFA